MRSYARYDGLPVLQNDEPQLPLLHPYAPGPPRPGRHITPGGGRLTIEESTTHHQVALDHLGCDAQTTPAKVEAFKQLALAAEGRCLRAGCRHRASFTAKSVYRRFEVLREGGIDLTAFVRGLLAIELGDFTPVAQLADGTTAVVGHPPREPDLSPTAVAPPS